MSTPFNSPAPPVFVDPAMQTNDELEELLKVTVPAELISFDEPELFVPEDPSVDEPKLFVSEDPSVDEPEIPIAEVPYDEDSESSVAENASIDIVENFNVMEKRSYEFDERRALPVFSKMKPAKFQRLINMSPTTFNKLAEIVCPMLPPGLSTNGKSYQPVERLLAFFYFCGHDTTSLHGSYAHGMSEGAVWQSVDIVLDVMHEHFVPEWLTLPTEEQARREARIFHEHTGFPDNLAWAVADGVHFILHNCPKEWRAECRNRKNSLSINGLIVAGASYRIYAALTDKGGSNHDMAILSTSELFRDLQNGWRPFPNAILLADKAFTATYPWMATPFPDIIAFHDPVKMLYQREFIRARNHGEQAYGVVKRRFAILRKGLSFANIAKCSKMINVLLAVHNFIMEQKGVDELSFLSNRPDGHDPELEAIPLPENGEDTHDYGRERRPIKTNEMICRQHYSLRNQRNWE